jgi:sulfur carrier protein
LASSARENPERVSLVVNGEARAVPTGSTVEALLRSLGLERRRVAVAVNRDVVPRSARGAHALRAGDRVEILEAVGGG